MLKVNQQDINLGTLTFGKTHEFTYELQNTASKDITVSKIVVGCTSCTKAHTDKTLLKPTETTTINVQFTPGSTGIQSKKILVYSKVDGSDLVPIELRFKAMVNG